ncbi:MAG: hypothetical protein BWY74_01626 [Firmicutes bacterium ADurb.Bin419]|nr:MAG: hypothetical protein BWY74_01626 [Firmicutes bacterium ADurb.Bin419]
MNIELLKSELEITLLTLATYNKEGQIISGLLSENLTLGTKRAIQKIHKKVYEAYKEFLEDAGEIKKLAETDKEAAASELQELLKEKVKIDAQPFLISKIEDISTTANYNFEIIEKIAQ